MIDLHSHILPGLDDGVASLAEARELAVAAADAGVTAIAATPHVRLDYPTTPDEMEAGVAAVREELANAQVRLDLLTGGEIDLGRLPLLAREDVERFTLAGTGRYLLLEFPDQGWPLSLELAIHGLKRDGITAVVAHPERNDAVQDRPARLAAAVDAGAVVQLTTGSLAGVLGRTAQATAKRLLRLGLVHLLASDVHHPDSRVLGAAAAAESIRDAGLVRYLTEEAPYAVVVGDDLPPRAAARRRRRLLPLGR